MTIVSLLVFASTMGMCKESIPSSETLVKIAKETLPAVVSIRVTKKTEKLVLKRPEKGKSNEAMPEDVPFELFEKFFSEEIPYLFEEKEMEMPAAGSGLIVSDDGYIATNYHVIADGKEDTIEVHLNNGKKFKGDDVAIVGKDTLTDMAVLKINAKDLTTAPWGNSDDLQIGEWVLALGNPFELSGSVTQGIVSAKHRVIRKAVLEDLIQTTAVINPGSSGGPLVNLKGDVVGINAAIATRSGIWQGVGFAIPAKVARRVVEEIIEFGHVQQGWIGIFMKPVNDDLKSFYGLEKAEGVFILEVVPESPAEKEGIQPYDVIVEMNNEPVKNPLDLLQRTASKSKGDKVDLKVVRLVKGEKKEISVRLELGSRPDEQGLASLHEKKVIPRSYDPIGLRVIELKEPGASGVEVTSVKSKSPAEKAGIAAGDVIVEINTRAITSLADYEQAIKEPQNKQLLVKVIRNAQEEVMVVKVK